MFVFEILFSLSTAIFIYFKYNIQLHDIANVSMDNTVFTIFDLW